MKKYLLIICSLYIVAFFAFGTYYEAYESMLSSFVQGIYTKPDIYDWNLDWHFLLFPLYAKLNLRFPDTQVYGVLFFIINLFCLTSLGWLLTKFLEFLIANSYRRILMFIILFTFLMLDNFINLSSTRIVFISMFTIFGWLEYSRIVKINIGTVKWIMLYTIILFLTLIRMDAVFLSSCIYIVYLILHKRFYKLSLFPLLTSTVFLFLYVFMVIPSTSTARQAFYNNELDFIDRNNVDYAKLSPLQKTEVEAARVQNVFDEEHFSPGFYNTISNSATGGSGLFNGLHLKYALITLENSAYFYLTSILFILFSIFPSLFLVFHFREKRKKWLLHFLICLFLPVAVCMYVITPSRFLVPFYSISGCLNLFLYIRYIGMDRKIWVFTILIFVFQLFLDGIITKSYLLQRANYKSSMEKLAMLQKSNVSHSPVIIYMPDTDKFFPVNPLEPVKRQGILLANLYYFNSYACYINAWKERCNCNPLSLKEKVDYMVASRSLFIIADEPFRFMQRYFNEKYHLQLLKTNVGGFDDYLSICKLSYGK